MNLSRVKDSYFTKKQALEILEPLQHTHEVNIIHLNDRKILYEIRSRNFGSKTYNYMIVKL